MVVEVIETPWDGIINSAPTGCNPYSHRQRCFLITSYISSSVSSDGSILTIGQEVKLGPSSSKVSNQYETIIMGKYNLAKAMLLGPPTLASTGFERNKYIIEEMRVARSMGKVAVAIFLKDIDATGLNLKYLTASDYSITRGELINPNRPMTRAEAIAKLKESKDLLELDMMSKEEFDALKAKLSPIIRGN